MTNGLYMHMPLRLNVSRNPGHPTDVQQCYIGYNH